jgi:hypothetical protein
MCDISGRPGGDRPPVALGREEVGLRQRLVQLRVRSLPPQQVYIQPGKQELLSQKFIFFINYLWAL